MKTFAFNRRTIEDQTIYVRAKSLEEAWQRARSDDSDATSDSAVLKITLRRLPTEDQA